MNEKLTRVDDKPGEECAVIGVYNHPEAARVAYQGLFALQHRGQEASGIASSDGNQLYKYVNTGLVADVFSDASIFDRLQGTLAIGHNRYSTTGSSLRINAQPLVVNSKDGPWAISHNGNFINSQSLRAELESEGSLFQTTTDTEIVLHLAAKSKQRELVGRVKEALEKVKGAYSMVIGTRKKLLAVRDPHGFRPLALGKRGDSYIVASESCAFDLVGAEFIREIEPGEMLLISDNQLHSTFLEPRVGRRACIFEYIYFSRPDSFIFGHAVDKIRRKFGKVLALEQPIDADIVISVPDSSNTAALGFSHRSGIKFEIGLIRNHYIGRTFILPDQIMRDLRTRLKFNPVKGVIEGRKIVIIDDSIVRGTTLRQLSRLLRRAGAKEIHVRVSSPPIRFPCFYGMDFPTSKELIAYQQTVDEVRKYIEVDSLGYLSLEGLLSGIPEPNGGFCTACFDGNYPIVSADEMSKYNLETPIIS